MQAKGTGWSSRRGGSTDASGHGAWNAARIVITVLRHQSVATLTGVCERDEAVNKEGLDFEIHSWRTRFLRLIGVCEMVSDGQRM